MANSMYDLIDKRTQHLFVVRPEHVSTVAGPLEHKGTGPLPMKIYLLGGQVIDVELDHADAERFVAAVDKADKKRK